MPERGPQAGATAGLEDLYPPETVAEIDRRARRPVPPAASPLSQRAAAGGLVAGLLLGVREALAPEPERPAVVEVDPRGLPGGEGVRLVLVADAPAASRAWVTRVGEPAPEAGRYGRAHADDRRTS